MRSLRGQVETGVATAGQMKKQHIRKRAKSATLARKKVGKVADMMCADLALPTTPARTPLSDVAAPAALCVAWSAA